MQFIKALLNGELLQKDQGNNLYDNGRLRVGIIGTGKIGVDLLVKVWRSPWLDCVIFVGRICNLKECVTQLSWVCVCLIKALMLFLKQKIAVILFLMQHRLLVI